MNAPLSKKIDDFFSNFPHVTFSVGEIVFHPDSKLNDIYYLTKGKVRMYSIAADGEEITLHIFRPSAFFPLMLVLSNIPNTYYFEAIESSSVFKVPSSSVLEFIIREPDVLFDLTRRFSDALCGLLVRIESLAGENARDKLIHLLLYLADKFGRQDGAAIIISLEITHEDVANWIGLRRETVSRLLEELKKENFVKLEKRKLVINDMNGLKLCIGSGY